MVRASTTIFSLASAAAAAGQITAPPAAACCSGRRRHARWLRRLAAPGGGGSMAPPPAAPTASISRVRPFSSLNVLYLASLPSLVLAKLRGFRGWDDCSYGTVWGWFFFSFVFFGAALSRSGLNLAVHVCARTGGT